MAPFAPGLFSMMTFWPSSALSLSAMSRATKSVGPPAGKATTTRMTRLGKSCARAGAATSHASAVSTTAQAVLRRGKPMSTSLDCATAHGGCRPPGWLFFCLSSASAFWHEDLAEESTCSEGAAGSAMKLRDGLILAAIVGGLALMFAVTRYSQPERVKPGSPEYEAYIEHYIAECLRNPQPTDRGDGERDTPSEAEREANCRV